MKWKETIQSKIRVEEPNPKYIPKNTPALKRQGTLQKRVNRLQEPEGGGVFSELVFSSNIRHYVHKVSPTWPPKCELNKSNNSRCEFDWEGTPS